MKKITFSIVIPAKNEADNIGKLVDEITEQLSSRKDYEIIYVDDGSTDATKKNVLAKKQSFPSILQLIVHTKSVGQSTAIYSGIQYATGQFIVTMDADGQNDPSDVPALLFLAEAQHLDADFCIAGYRKLRKDTRWKRLQSKVANTVRARLLNDDTPDTGCGLKVFPKKTFLKLPYFNHMHRYLPALVKRMGGSIFVVEVSHRDREHGQSKYGMWGRLGAGLIDMLGVIWLQKRTKLPVVVKTTFDNYKI